jgi:hypothetical protein
MKFKTPIRKYFLFRKIALAASFACILGLSIIGYGFSELRWVFYGWAGYLVGILSGLLLILWPGFLLIGLFAGEDALKILNRHYTSYAIPQGSTLERLVELTGQALEGAGLHPSLEKLTLWPISWPKSGVSMAFRIGAPPIISEVVAHTFHGGRLSISIFHADGDHGSIDMVLARIKEAVSLGHQPPH